MESTNLTTKQTRKITSFGVHSCRYNTFEILEDNFLIFPCGIYLYKFDFLQNKNINKLQISDSIVYAMKRNSNYLVVASHNGDCCVVDIESFEVLGRFKVPYANKIHQVTVSEDMRYITGCCQFYLDPTTNKVQNGAVFIFKRIDKDINYPDEKTQINKSNLCSTNLTYKFDSLLLLFSFDSFFEFSSIDNCRNQKFVLIERNKKDFIKEDNSNNNNKEYSQSFYDVKEYLIGSDGKLTILHESPLDGDSIDNYSILNSKKYKDYLVLNTSKRIIKFFHLTSLRTIINIKFEGAGCLGTFEIKSGQLYLSNLSGNLLCLDLQDFLKSNSFYYQNNKNVLNIIITKHGNVVNNLNETLNLSARKIIENDLFLSQHNFSLNVNEEMNLIFWTNEKGLFGIDMREKKYLLKKESLLKMSGCGVAINHKKNLIAVGDLEQNIVIINSFLDEKCSSSGHDEEKSILFKFKAKGAIRTVHWDEHLDVIYVGTMNGKILECDSNHMEIVEIYDLKHTITCIKVFDLEKLGTNEKKFLLIASTTQGYIHIFNISFGNEISKKKDIFLIKSFLAHPADHSCEDLRFGSLKLKAEIWSITSYPNTILNSSPTSLDEKSFAEKFQLITSSEDQTIKIWEFSLLEIEKDPQLLHQFKNHELAVTCVDWKPMKVLNGEVLVSCSDDRTINIYDPSRGFELVKTLKTDFIYDPHTITYISLEENGKHLAVSTINGHIVIFSLETWECVFSEKLHLGGVEGLCWKKDLLVSCASDLNVSIINIKY